MAEVIKLVRPEEPQLTDPEGIESGQSFLDRISWIFAKPYNSKFGAMWLDQLDDPGPEHSFIVDGWFSRGDKSIIAGARGSGKTFFALELALCVAYGRPLFGLHVNRGGVVYQAGEGQAGLKKRLRAWRQYHGTTFERDTPFVMLQNPINLYKDTAQTTELIAEIKMHGEMFKVPLSLIVIDTFAMATVGADEISGKDMGVVMENLSRINRETGAHVLLVHHMNASGGRERGHTSIGANVDQVAYVRRDLSTGIRTVSLDKQKDDIDGSEIRFILKSERLGTSETGRDVTSCVCISINEREAVRKEEETKGMRISVQAEGFMRSFFAAETRYGMPVPPNYPMMDKGVRALVPWIDMKKLFEESTPDDSLVPDKETSEEAAERVRKYKDAMKKRIQKMREDLVGAGVLNMGSYDFNNGKAAVIWHTGKPLRAFPSTWPKPMMEEKALDGGIPF